MQQRWYLLFNIAPNIIPLRTSHNAISKPYIFTAVLSFTASKIAKELGLHRNTVSKIPIEGQNTKTQVKVKDLETDIKVYKGTKISTEKIITDFLDLYKYEEDFKRTANDNDIFSVRDDAIKFLYKIGNLMHTEYSNYDKVYDWIASAFKIKNLGYTPTTILGIAKNDAKINNQKKNYELNNSINDLAKQKQHVLKEISKKEVKKQKLNSEIKEKMSTIVDIKEYDELKANFQI